MAQNQAHAKQKAVDALAEPSESARGNEGTALTPASPYVRARKQEHVATEGEWENSRKGR